MERYRWERVEEGGGLLRTRGGRGESREGSERHIGSFNDGHSANDVWTLIVALGRATF